MNVHGNESAPVAVGAARGKLADGAAASRVSTPQMRRQILLLASAQALFQAVSVAVTTVGSLAGSQLASSPSWATAPVATMFLGTALATAPASMGMARIGRRAGFLIGSGLGVLGGLVGASGVYAGSLLLLCLGTLLVGAYQGFAQFYRFAASEVASEAFRPRAIALVMAGGVVAAIAGPAIGRFGEGLMQPAYTASFLAISAVSLVATGVLLGVKVPPSTAAHSNADTGRGLAAIVRQPSYLVAIFGAATGYGIMILAMTATPLAMRHHHHGLADTATVIQLHVLGMFLPSFMTGGLIARFGVLNVMFAGVAALGGHVLLSLSGTGFYSFSGALTLLGIGWNLLYIGGTNLLTRTYTPVEKGKAQAANDLSIFTVGVTASLSAGVLQEAVGWQAMNLMLLPWLALAGAAILALGRSKHGRPAPGAIG